MLFVGSANGIISWLAVGCHVCDLMSWSEAQPARQDSVDAVLGGLHSPSV